MRRHRQQLGAAVQARLLEQAAAPAHPRHRHRVAGLGRRAVGGERKIAHRRDVRHHLVAALGAGSQHRRRGDTRRQLRDRACQRRRRVRGEHLVLGDMRGADAVRAQPRRGLRRTRPGQHRVHLAAGGEPLCQRDRLQRYLVCGPVGVLDVDQHQTSPASRSTATTAGAADAPSPSICVCLPCPAGRRRRTFSTPGSRRSGVRVSSGFRFARSLPGTDG